MDLPANHPFAVKKQVSAPACSPEIRLPDMGLGWNLISSAFSVLIMPGLSEAACSKKCSVEQAGWDCLEGD